MRLTYFRKLFLALFVLAALAVSAATVLSLPRTYLLLSTTTSTRDTGLLDWLLPQFAADAGIEVRYTAVGTGQALDAGRRGDADVVMVHAPSLENQFMAEGQGLCRDSIMFNTFVVVGPAADPAGVAGAANATDAFRRIHDNATLFESRADNSGTYNKELAIWAAAGLNVSTFGSWYEKTSQGMGNTLTIANNLGGYTLSDDGTWYALSGNLPGLHLLYSHKDAILKNQYSVIPANPALHPGLHTDQALAFARWLSSVHGQSLISNYTVNGHRIFTPDFVPGRPGAC